MNLRAAVCSSLLAVAILCIVVAADSGKNPPDGLSGSDWSGIRAAYESKRHEAFAVDGGYQARNPGQQWRTRFDGRGFTTTPDGGEWSWGLELVDFGVAPAQVVAPAQIVAPVSNRCVALAPAMSQCGSRVEYAWDEILTEWYVNDSRGLEHGYTVHERPEVHRFETDATAPLQFTLAVRGNLRPQVSSDRRGVTFVNDAGAAVVNYGGLKVFDARGVSLPAWFEGESDQPSAISGQVEDNPQSNLPMERPAPGAPRRGSEVGIQNPQCITIAANDCDAVYPLTIDPIAQQAYLKASNSGTDDRFGSSLSVSGDTVVVGAFQEDSSSTGVNGNQGDTFLFNGGAAYVFVRSGGVWTQQAYLKASNTGMGDCFGLSVAVSGDTVVVGAYEEDSSATGINGNQTDNAARNSGAAYVFVRNGTTWSQQAYLKASNTGADDLFGVSVDVSGDTVVVGAYQEDSNATGMNGNQADNSASGSGAAYVFIRSGGVWSQQAYIKASNTGGGDAFGYPVIVSGGTVVVGANSEDSSATGVNGNQADNSASGSGAAYVFIRSGTTWGQQAYVKASNTAAFDAFGWSLAVSDDTLVVGAYAEDSGATGVNGDQLDNSVTRAGAAYVFVRTDLGWTQQAYLKASNTGTEDWFGSRVAVSDDTVVVTAPGEDSSAVDVNGNEADDSAQDSGAAYVFVRTGTNWSERAYLKASNTGAADNFGSSVSISGDTVLIGAWLEASSATGVDGNQTDNSNSASGAAYVFKLWRGLPTTPAALSPD